MTEYKPSKTDIAVIGLAGRFPGAQNVDEYWRNLCEGVESVTFLSPEDLREAGIPDEVATDPDYVPAAYLLKDADCFDASFFGYNPREAKFIDPQQRVLLDCAWEALEDAGYADGKPRPTGVFVGSSLNTYLLFTGIAGKFKTEPVLTLMSNDKDFLATRISYKLNLEGPSVTVQTACSTSLVAVHQACQSILAGECDMALAGGVCVKVPLKAGYLYREGGMLSKDGHCRAFDAAATGTVFGSGAGIVLLKRYTEAVREGDHVAAIIRGTAVNNDGSRKASYTAPSVAGIAEVIGQSMDFAEVQPSQISYFECHGTGTALGDPIELHAMTKAFGTQRQIGCCAIGSVKTNVGHLEAASGIASFIKVVCSLRDRYLPKTLHFRTPNPALALHNSPFRVNACGREWDFKEDWRIAAINSMGVGGTNANVILQEAGPSHRSPSRRLWHLLPVSGKSESAVKTAASRLAAHLDSFPDTQLADAAYTLSVGRTHFPHRDVLITNQSQLAACEQPLHTGGPVLSRSLPTVFLFGNHFDRVLADALLRDEPMYAEVYRDLRATGLRQEALLHQIALAVFWKGMGLVPQAALGDGVGRLAAAFVMNAASMQQILSPAPAPECPHPTYFVSDGTRGAEQLSAASSAADALACAIQDLLGLYSAAIFVPIGSSCALSASLEEHAGGFEQHTVFPPLRRREPDHIEPSELLLQAAALWKAGANLELASFYTKEERRRMSLPGTVLEARRYWP